MKKKQPKNDKAKIDVTSLEAIIKLAKDGDLCLFSLICVTKKEGRIYQHHFVSEANMTNGALFCTVLEKRLFELKKEAWDSMEVCSRNLND